MGPDDLAQQPSPQQQFDSLPLDQKFNIVYAEYRKLQQVTTDLKAENVRLTELLKSQYENEMDESSISDVSDEGEPQHNKKSRASSKSPVQSPQSKKIKTQHVSNTIVNPVIQSTAAPLSKKSSPPAIMAYFSNHKEMIASLTKYLKNNNFTVFIKKDIVKIQCLTNIEFQATKEFLKTNNVQFYTFTPKEEKPTTLVIKNISDTYDAEEIKAAIESKVPGINIINLRNLFKLNWLVQLKTKEDVKSLKSIRSLLGQGIKIENFRGNKTMQCKRCQRYNHIALNCNMPYRCVKCGLSHEIGQCTIPSKEENKEVYVIDLPDGTKTTRTGLQLKCANCGGDHAANFSKCPARPVKEVSAPNAQQNRIIQQEKPKTTFRNPNVSYSKTVSSNITSKVNEFNLHQEINELFGKDLNTYKISNFIPKYNSLQNKEDKKVAMFNLMFQICLT